MEKAAVTLEQDHPTIFKYRHAIVAAGHSHSSARTGRMTESMK